MFNRRGKKKKKKGHSIFIELSLPIATIMLPIYPSTHHPLARLVRDAYTGHHVPILCVD